MSKELCDAVLRQARDILARHPDLAHRWNEHGSNHELTFPALDPTGFDVIVSIEENGTTLFARGAHRHVQPIEGQDVESLASETLGLVRDLLSPDMRIREFCASGSAYRWQMEACTADGWKAVEVTALIFWNYFGRRLEKIYQNHILPGRLRQQGVQSS
jgi:hypothetical protein